MNYVLAVLEFEECNRRAFRVEESSISSLIKYWIENSCLGMQGIFLWKCRWCEGVDILFASRYAMGMIVGLGLSVDFVAKHVLLNPPHLINTLTGLHNFYWSCYFGSLCDSLFLNFFLTIRYSLREGVSGRQQHNPRSSSEPFNGITAMHTWMLRNRMQLMCKLYILSYSRTAW